MAVRELDDGDLVHQVINGNQRAFNELMGRHEDRVFAVCIRLMRNREAALDAVQDTFLTVFRKIDQFRGDSSFSTWLYRVAVNTCYDHLRRAKRRQTEPLPEGNDPIDLGTESDISAVELRPNLNLALGALTEEFRSAVLLVDVEGLSVADASLVLEIAEGTVKSRLHRARKKMAEILGNPDGYR